MANVNTTLIARAVCVALAMAGGVAVRAQEPPAPPAPSESNLDVTIRLLPENAAGPEDITRRIQLPPAAANRAPPPRPESGADKDHKAAASDDKEKGRGNEAADEARERGREAGKETADQARGNRENAGRPDDSPGRGPKDEPGPRGRPDTPPGRH